MRKEIEELRGIDLIRVEPTWNDPVTGSLPNHMHDGVQPDGYWPARLTMPLSLKKRRYESGTDGFRIIRVKGIGRHEHNHERDPIGFTSGREVRLTVDWDAPNAPAIAVSAVNSMLTGGHLPNRYTDEIREMLRSEESPVRAWILCNWIERTTSYLPDGIPIGTWTTIRDQLVLVDTQGESA